jgi:predicted  nucleic acid-binding Zn-ribbon protein
MPIALSARVTVLEKSMDTAGSRISRLEISLTEFRTEVREEFAAVRAEARKEFAAVRGEIVAVRSDVGKLSTRIDAVQVTLSKEIQEIHRVMLALFEQLKEQIKTMGEGRSGSARP